MTSATDLGGLSWKEFAKRVGRRFNEDDVLGRSAQLAFYFFLAIFPMLLFLTALLGVFAGASPHLRDTLMQRAGSFLPESAAPIFSKAIDQITKGSSGGLMSFGVLTALWSASSGMSAIQDTTNSAYEVGESRSWIRARSTAVWLTVVVTLLVVAAVVLLTYGFSIAQAVVGSNPVLTIGWKIVQWPVLIFFLVLGIGLIYRFAPDLEDPKWHWITPGAIAAVLVWLIASFGLREYFHFSHSYMNLYGSIGAVMILMLWFYVTGIALLLGAEINSVIENAAARRGRADAHPKGQREPRAA